MAHFALLWKARTIEKYRLNYENEKYKSILAGNTPIPQQSLSQRWRHYRYNTKKRISMTFRRLYPEGSSLYNFFLYFQADQSCLNIVLKSLLGFSIGIGLTYLSFLFFIFQLSISLLHATIMSSIIGVLLTMGLAFSYRIRCLIFLLIPQFFSRAGRYTLTCYALVLILTGPATNTLKNSEVLSESMACQQEQLKTLVNEISHSTKKPYNLMKESMKIMVERLRLFASGMKETVLKVNRLILSILQVIQSAFSWLNSLSDICNKNIGTPYERCKRAVEDGIKNCEKKFGPKSQRICNATDKVQAACLKFKRYKVICVFVDLIKGSIVATIKKLLFIGGPEMREDLSILLSLFERYLVPSKGLKNFSRRIRSMLYLQIHISHSYTFSGNTSHSPGQVAAGIVTEIRKRADPILTWLSWSSCVTSLFLLLIIFRAKYYQHMYDTRSRFDNRYITKEMRDLDLKRLRQGRETVLPLNRRERSKYITTTSFRLVTSEKIYLNRSAVFMAITTFKLMIHMAADYSLYWVLTTIRHHGSMQTPLPFGPPNAGMQMSGSGRIAELFRWLLEALTTPLEIPLPSHTACLPDPHPPDLQRYGQIGVLIFLLWFFALFEPYGLRLRHVIMGRYRPERAKARAEWLYNHILRTRGGFMKFARRKLHKSFKYTTEEKYTFKAFLRNHIPFSCLRYLLGLGPEEPRCLLCGTTEYVNDRNTQLQKCDTPRCIGIYCSSCFSDIGQLCTICLQPKDYGDLSDVSLEKGSSDESDDDTDDDIKHGRHSASQDHCSEIQVNDVNEQTPFPNPTKERKRSIYHSNVNNGCLEKLPLIDNLHRYTESSALIFTNDLDDKRKENRLAKGFKKEQNYCYNYDQNKQNNKVKSIVITLKDNVTKPISYMEKKNVNAITEIGLNTPKESEYKNGCNISIFVNRITTGFCRMIESRQFMVCPLVTLQNGNKNIILRNGKNDIRRGLLKSGRSGNDCLKEISNKQSDIHSRLKCGTISLNFYDVDVSKKNIVVKKIMHPSVSIRSLGNEKNQAVKKRRHILNFNHHDTNNVNNRYFMTLNDEPFTDNTALKINEYSRCNRNEETNNTKKNKQKNEHDVKEITTQNFENGDNKINVLESKNEKSSCCFQTICYLYRQHMKCNKSTGCNTHSQKTTDIQKNHKSRKKHKSKAKLRKKNKIRNHKKDDEDTRNCRILAYLDEQDWMKRNVHKIENDDSGTVLSTANENGTFDYKENKIANRENIIERDNHQAKAATNLCPNCVVQNCDMKNLYLSKEQSIQLKSNNNTSFDIERRLAFCNQLANPDVDEKHLKYHVETYTTGINLKKTANSGQSDTSSNLKMPREESNENENRCHICGICCSIRKRLQNILDQISKASSRSETCFNNIVEKIVSIIPGDTCGVDCNGDENNIDGKEVPINCEEHICTCKDIDGYDLVKKISSIVRKHIHMRFKENPETANKCENTTTTCKEFSSHELIKKISSHVRKYVKIMYNERTENANKLEKVICNCNKVASPELDKPEREHKCENAPSTSKEFTNYELVKIISSHVRKYMKTMFKEKPHTMHKCENTPSTYQEYANYNLDKKICSHVKKYMKIMKLKEKAKMANKSNVRCEEQNKIAKMQTTSKAITDSGCQCGSYGQDYCNGNFTRDEDNMKMPDKDTAIHRFINCLANKNVSASPEMRTCSCQYCIDDEGSAKKRKQSPPKTLKQQKKVNKTANLGDLPSNSCQCREDAQESKSLARIFKNIYKRLFNKKIESEIDEKKSKRKTKKENKGKLKKKKNKEKQNEKDGKKAKKFPVPPPESCHCQHEVLDQRTEDCNKKEICKTKECRQTIKQATPWQTNKAVKKEKQKVPTDEKRNGVESSYSPSCSCRHFAKRKDNTQAILKETKEKAVKKRKAVLSKTVAFQSFRPTAINNKETTAAPLMYSCSCHKCLDSKLIQNKVTQTSKSMGVNAGTQDAPSCLSCACGSSTFPPKKCTCASQYNAWDIPGNNDDSACLILPQKDITLDGLMALQLNLAQDEREKKHSKASTSNSTSSTPNTSSLISEVSVTDTTICNMTYIDDYKKINKTPRMTVVTKSNRGTEMEKINVCDVSTLTSDWWSPMLEKKNVKDKDHLEKKRGDHRIHKNIGRKDRIVSTDGKYVSFKSKAQLIPDIPVDILSPARYLLESQKYYNELFLSKCHAPTVYPVNRSQIKRRQENRSSIGSHSRRNHRIKRREDISTLRKQI